MPIILLAAVLALAMAATTAWPAGAAPPAQDSHRIVVLAYPDLAGDGPEGADCPGCDGRFSTADALLGREEGLPALEVILRDADGEEIDRQTTDELPNGRQAATFEVDDAGDYEIEIVDEPSDWKLCPGGILKATIVADDFESDTKTARAQFSFWKGCDGAAAEPAAAGAAEATAVPAQTTAEATAEATVATGAEAAAPTVEAHGAVTVTTEMTTTAATTAMTTTTAMTAAVAPGSISGLVFVDANVDGVLASDEAGVPGVEVRLIGGGLALGQLTSSAGNYSFGGLPAGTYDVSVTVPWGYALTTPDTVKGVAVAGDMVVGVDFGTTPVQYAAPTAAPAQPTLPSTGVSIAPAGRVLLGLAIVVGALGILGLAVEGRFGRKLPSSSRKDS